MSGGGWREEGGCSGKCAALVALTGGAARGGAAEPGLRFFAGDIGKEAETPALLSIYVAKKRAPWPLAYLSISQKNGRLTFFLFFYFLFLFIF